MKWIADDILNHLKNKHGMYANFNEVLRFELGLPKPARKKFIRTPKQKKQKPKLRKRKLTNLELLETGQTARYSRDDWNWKSIENATRNINKKYKFKERFYSLHYDVYYLYVTRLR